MSKPTQSLLSKTYLNVIAFVTALALLAIPICAPLCATKACSSNASNEPCHEMATMGAEGGEHFTAPARSCGSFEFSAVLVKGDEQDIGSQELRISPSAKIRGVQAEHGRPVEFSNSMLSRPSGVRLQSQDSLPLTAVLRT